MKKDRNYILGSLLGFAIGDAMGATTEFMTQEKIHQKYGEVNQIIGGGWLNLTPGEVTDDTQMMMIVANARMKGKCEFLHNCCTGFVKWLKSNPVDVGGACGLAISQGGSNPPREWMRLSKRRQEVRGVMDLGNGAVMRTLFLALSGEIDLAIGQGRLTHNNSESSYYIDRYCQSVFSALYAIPLYGPFLMAPTGHVKNSVNNAIYWSSHSTNFKEAIIGPVNHGGDADTIAALTGGIAGACYGADNIPREWVEALDLNVVEDLMNMADWLMDNP